MRWSTATREGDVEREERKEKKREHEDDARQGVLQGEARRGDTPHLWHLGSAGPPQEKARIM